LYFKGFPTIVTRVILLDRDGVINRDSTNFVKSVEEFVPLPGAIEAIARLSQAGYRLGVCTNQSGIGRGLLTEAEARRIHDHLLKLVEAGGGTLGPIVYCPHLPDAGCDCRKPKPGMLLRAMAELEADAADTTFVGDSMRDLLAARAAGCAAVLVRSGNGAGTEEEARAEGFGEVFDDLSEFSRALPAASGGGDS
jgi:D-glycero-D-manno-heptose 1,7-bisphosphate phosphatase